MIKPQVIPLAVRPHIKTTCILLHGISIWYYSMPTTFVNPKYNECKRFFFVCNKNVDKHPIFLEIKKNASTLKNISFTEFIYID